MTTHGLPACPQCHQNTNVEQRKRPGCTLHWFACSVCEHAFCVWLPAATKLVAIGLVASLAMACTATSVAGPTGPTLPAAVIVQDGERAPDPAGAADVASGSITLTGPCEAEALLSTRSVSIVPITEFPPVCGRSPNDTLAAMCAGEQRRLSRPTPTQIHGSGGRSTRNGTFVATFCRIAAAALHRTARCGAAFPLVSVLRRRDVLVAPDDTPDCRAPKTGRRVDDGFGESCAEMQRDLAGIKAILEKLADAVQALTAARRRTQQ